MPLQHSVDGESLIQQAKEHPHRKLLKRDNHDSHSLVYASRAATEDVPKWRLPGRGMPADDAYQLVHDELILDGNPTLNLASFVHTWMPPQADKLMLENMSKNLIDTSEYEQTDLIHARCVSMLSSLWHGHDPARETKDHKPIGTACTGSSEAIQLGGLAMKKRWQEARKAAGKSAYEPGPNIVMGANAQVALEKFAKYFDVEMRLVPVTLESRYCMDPKRAMQFVDENTIGVFVILGSTYTGHFENVEEMCTLLDEYEAKTGHNVPVHVDGASGAFVAPFVYPQLKWDFRLPRVVSINASGHKFGLAYVGVGWVVWRDPAFLPKDLVFELHYLGSVEYSFSLNFSRPAAPIIAQYFSFLHLGFEGYKKILNNDFSNARLLARALELSGYYEVLSEVHKPSSAIAGAIESGKQAASMDDNPANYVPALPVIAFRFSEKFRSENPDIKQKWIQTLLRAKGWIVPNYELPPELDTTEILRVVVRENCTEDLIDRLVCDLMEITESLGDADSPAQLLAQVSTKKSGSGEKQKPGQQHGTKPETSAHGVC